MSPQACEHAALAQLQEGRDRARAPRRCACGFLPCPHRRAADRVCVPRAQRIRLCCARHPLPRNAATTLPRALHYPTPRSLRESLGISADGSEKAFHTTDIETLMKRVPDPIIYDVRNPENNVNHIFVACDPSGGGASAFSVASLVQDARGFSHVRRLPSTPSSRSLSPPSTRCTTWTLAPRDCLASGPCR